MGWKPEVLLLVRLKAPLDDKTKLKNPFKKTVCRVFTQQTFTHLNLVCGFFFLISRLEGKGANEMTKVVHTEDGTNAHRFDHS